MNSVENRPASIDDIVEPMDIQSAIEGLSELEQRQLMKTMDTYQGLKEGLLAYVGRGLDYAWGSDTSMDPYGWSPKNKAHMQCRNTVLIINEKVDELRREYSEKLKEEPISERVRYIMEQFLADPQGNEIHYTEAILPDEGQESHYYNFIDGAVVDKSASQFPNKTKIPLGGPVIKSKNDKKLNGKPAIERLLEEEVNSTRYKNLQKRFQKYEVLTALVSQMMKDFYDNGPNKDVALAAEK